MIDSLTLIGHSPQETAQIGTSLASCLYHENSVILLTGELGAGKTVFTQGFAKGLGISDPVTSPTYAIEDRHGETLLHIDLFRIEKKEEARSIIAASEEFPGVRVIEWPERAGVPFWESSPHIEVHLSDTGDGKRVIAVSFHDIALPTDAQVKKWRQECGLPAHIAKHTDLVADMTLKICDALIDRSVLIRKEAARKAALIHDLLRFTDFKEVPAHVTSAMAKTWRALRERYGTSHEEAVHLFMNDKGFPEIGRIALTHGRRIYTDEGPHTIEQKIVSYADKRVLHDKMVTLEERFTDLGVRYADGKMSPEQKRWYAEMQTIEWELFPEGVPF